MSQEINIGMRESDRIAIADGLSWRMELHEKTAWMLRSTLEE